jgi:hypothetical protein
MSDHFLCPRPKTHARSYPWLLFNNERFSTNLWILWLCLPCGDHVVDRVCPKGLPGRAGLFLPRVPPEFPHQNVDRAAADRDLKAHRRSLGPLSGGLTGLPAATGRPLFLGGSSPYRCRAGKQLKFYDLSRSMCEWDRLDEWRTKMRDVITRKEAGKIPPFHLLLNPCSPRLTPSHRA